MKYLKEYKEIDWEDFDDEEESDGGVKKILLFNHSIHRGFGSNKIFAGVIVKDYNSGGRKMKKGYYKLRLLTGELPHRTSFMENLTVYQMEQIQNPNIMINTGKGKDMKLKEIDKKYDITLITNIVDITTKYKIKLFRDIAFNFSEYLTENINWEDFDDEEFDIKGYVSIEHGDQKYNSHPYVYHLENVKNVCERFIDMLDFTEREKEVIIISAWCHDLLEDTEVTYEDMVDRFGEDVAFTVNNLTGYGENRKARNLNAYNKIKKDKVSTFIKLCDRISNTEESINNNPKLMVMYKKEYPDFKNHLKKDGELEEMWNYLDELYGL